MYACAKAVVAGVLAGLSCCTGNGVGDTRLDIITDIVAALVTFSGTYFVPNRGTTVTRTTA